MEAAFWHERWRLNEIGFHEQQVNVFLEKYFEKLSLSEAGRIFVPLCGKSKDMLWLLSKGFQVVGVELSPLAVEQFFNESGIKPKISRVEEFSHYSALGMDIFVGDVFELSADVIGHVDAVYDRAALVALPEAMRGDYTKQLLDITGNAQQLLICFDYKQEQMAGPPFSISEDEIFLHYGDNYIIELLESRDVAGGLKGICPAKENAWFLKS